MNKQSPDKFTSTISKPHDFMTFWRNVEEGASKVPPNFQVEYSFLHSSNESMLNLDVAFIFRIAQTANKSELSILSASESSRTLRPFISI